MLSTLLSLQGRNQQGAGVVRVPVIGCTSPSKFLRSSQFHAAWMTNLIHSQIEHGSPPAKHPLPGLSPRRPSGVGPSTSSAEREHRPRELIDDAGPGYPTIRSLTHPACPASISAQDQPRNRPSHPKRLIQDTNLLVVSCLPCRMFVLGPADRARCV